MSVASTLLRVVLMLSLLLNGVNAAMASGHALQGPIAHDMATAAADEPDCHHSAGMQATSVPETQAPAHDSHCQMKDCVRSCAQQPLLAVQPLALPVGPAWSPAPPQVHASGRLAPPLPPISRPPIG